MQRQIRLSSKDNIQKELDGLLSKQINIVLIGNEVIFGKLTEVQTDSIIVQNMRLKKISIPKSKIYELYLDFND